MSTLFSPYVTFSLVASQHCLFFASILFFSYQYILVAHNLFFFLSVFYSLSLFFNEGFVWSFHFFLFSFIPVFFAFLHSISFYSHITKFVRFMYCFLSHQQHFKLLLLSFSVISSILSIYWFYFFYLLLYHER